MEQNTLPMTDPGPEFAPKTKKAIPWSSVLKFLKDGFFILIVLVSFSAGYMAKGYVVDKFPQQSLDVLSSADVSTAISNRGELVILNRHNGKYIQYSDSVLQSVYHQYRAKLTYTKDVFIPQSVGMKK